MEGLAYGMTFSCGCSNQTPIVPYCTDLIQQSVWLHPDGHVLVVFSEVYKFRLPCPDLPVICMQKKKTQAVTSCSMVPSVWEQYHV